MRKDIDGLPNPATLEAEELREALTELLVSSKCYRHSITLNGFSSGANRSFLKMLIAAEQVASALVEREEMADA